MIEVKLNLTLLQCPYQIYILCHSKNQAITTIQIVLCLLSFIHLNYHLFIHSNLNILQHYNSQITYSISSKVQIYQTNKIPPVISASFQQYLKSANNMKLSSDAAVVQIIYKSLTNFENIQYFDKKSIESLTSTCEGKVPAITEGLVAGISVEQEIAGAEVSSISTQRLIIASFATTYHLVVGRTMTNANMYYGNVLKDFKVDWEAYMALKEEGAP